VESKADPPNERKGIEQAPKTHARRLARGVTPTGDTPATDPVTADQGRARVLPFRAPLGRPPTCRQRLEALPAPAPERVSLPPEGPREPASVGRGVPGEPLASVRGEGPHAQRGERPRLDDGAAKPHALFSGASPLRARSALLTRDVSAIARWMLPDTATYDAKLYVRAKPPTTCKIASRRGRKFRLQHLIRISTASVTRPLSSGERLYCGGKRRTVQVIVPVDLDEQALCGRCVSKWVKRWGRPWALQGSFLPVRRKAVR
jgi:hypothetical protein